MDEKPITLYEFCTQVLQETATFRFYLAWWARFLQMQGEQP